MAIASRRSLFLSSTLGLAFAGACVPAIACDAECPYIGTVCAVAFNFCPQGYLQANGAVVNVNQYAALYALIGNMYGGTAPNTFALPDLRARTLVGTGQSPDSTATTPIALAQKVGQQGVALNANQMAPHIHPATFTPVTGPVAITIPATTGDLAVSTSLPVSTNVGTTTGATSALTTGPTGSLAGLSGASGLTAVNFKGPYTTAAPAAGSTATLPATVQVTGTASTAAVTTNITSITGGAVGIGPNNTTLQAVPTQAPGLGLTMCIAVNGLYPTRP